MICLDWSQSASGHDDQRTAAGAWHADQLQPDARWIRLSQMRRTMFHRGMAFDLVYLGLLVQIFCRINGPRDWTCTRRVIDCWAVPQAGSGADPRPKTGFGAFWGWINPYVKGKGFPILDTERWARSWSWCTGSQPAGDRKSSTRR